MKRGNDVARLDRDIIREAIKRAITELKEYGTPQDFHAAEAFEIILQKIEEVVAEHERGVKEALKL